jgi:hypothetical protein
VGWLVAPKGEGFDWPVVPNGEWVVAPNDGGVGFDCPVFPNGEGVGCNCPVVPNGEGVGWS